MQAVFSFLFNVCHSTELLHKPIEEDLLSWEKVMCDLSVSGHLLDSRRTVKLIHLDRKQHDCTYLVSSDRSDLNGV